MEEIERYILDSRRRCAINARGHYLAGDNLSRWSHALGVPVVVLTAVVGTAIFGSLESNPDLKWKVLAGMISLTATVLSALQTYLSLGQRSEKHRVAGVSYSALRREFELERLRLQQVPKGGEAAFLDQLKPLLHRLDEAAMSHPSIPDKFWKQAHAEHPDPGDTQTRRVVS